VLFKVRHERTISDTTFGNDDPLSTQPNDHPLLNAIALFTR
jgi:hypothetical protein